MIDPRSEASSPASADSISGSSAPDGSAAGRLRLSHIAGPFLRSIGRRSLGSRMYAPLGETLSASISSAEASPAKTSQTLIPTGDGARSPEESRVSGASSVESFIPLLLPGSWSRTLPPAVVGCPMCGPILPGSDTPPCRWNCAPARSALPIVAPGSFWWPTPTAKANHCAPSMQKWPGYLRFQRLVGTGGRPHPEVFDWMMGFPQGWTALEQPATRSSRKSQNGSDGD